MPSFSRPINPTKIIFWFLLVGQMDGERNKLICEAGWERCDRVVDGIRMFSLFVTDRRMLAATARAQ